MSGMPGQECYTNCLQFVFDQVPVWKILLISTLFEHKDISSFSVHCTCVGVIKLIQCKPAILIHMQDTQETAYRELQNCFGSSFTCGRGEDLLRHG